MRQREFHWSFPILASRPSADQELMDKDGMKLGRKLFRVNLTPMEISCNTSKVADPSGWKIGVGRKEKHSVKEDGTAGVVVRLICMYIFLGIL